jgi:hypothetical protein
MSPYLFMQIEMFAIKIRSINNIMGLEIQGLKKTSVNMMTLVLFSSSQSGSLHNLISKLDDSWPL